MHSMFYHDNTHVHHRLRYESAEACRMTVNIQIFTIIAKNRLGKDNQPLCNNGAYASISIYLYISLNDFQASGLITF